MYLSDVKVTFQCFLLLKYKKASISNSGLNGSQHKMVSSLSNYFFYLLALRVKHCICAIAPKTVRQMLLSAKLVRIQEFQTTSKNLVQRVLLSGANPITTRL